MIVITILDIFTSISIIFTLLYNLTIEQFLMQLYLGCTLVSNLIHSLMLSNMFSAGGGAIYDAPKARGGAIFDAHKPRGGAIFVASKPWGGAIFVASKPQGGAIFVASRPWGGAIFVAYHWNVLIKNAKFQKINFLPSIYSLLYNIQSKYLLEFISQEKTTSKWTNPAIWNSLYAAVYYSKVSLSRKL